MTTSPISTPTSSGWKSGMVLFAAIFMLVSGILEFLRGLTALFENTLFLRTPKYLFAFDVTAWGWIHLLWGVVLAVAGGLILANKAIGRVLGLAIVTVAVVLNFLSLPYYPFWSLVLLVLNGFIIWALCTAPTTD